ncbi:MAG: HAMP domain-containing sensor histidine kinase [Pirellulales bacterium]
MLKRWPIRYKLYLGGATLWLTLALLAFSGLRGPYAYKHLAWTISKRSAEIPRAAALTKSVADLRALGRSTPADEVGVPLQFHWEDPVARDAQFRTRLADVRVALQLYREQLERNGSASRLSLDDDHEEWRTVSDIERSLDRLDRMQRSQNLFSNDLAHSTIDRELDDLFQLASSLPNHLHGKMQSLVNEVRWQYRAWIYLTWISGFAGATLLVALIGFFYFSIFRPLRELVEESRKISGGNLRHRIRVNTADEVAELANAMNDMTDAFQKIRDNLDEQVKQRTREVVRSEQLASVGFLAAGVAHEINNPLASIAWSAEALESRVRELLESSEETQDDSEVSDNEESSEGAAPSTLPFPTLAADDHQRRADIEVVHRYLRRIQEEAFRCKGITEKLLDFSRLGDVERHPTNLADLVRGVIEMVQSIGTYREKQVEFTAMESVTADVNAAEVKQVVLNLLTNALDSLDPGGKVCVHLRRRGDEAELEVVDNGCGMTPEVLQHLFEPFFTRRRDGQGTGLGMSITYRIVQDHGGTIEAESEGPGHGSRLRVILPLAESEKRAVANGTAGVANRTASPLRSGESEISRRAA